MTTPDPLDLDHVQGTALAALLLTTTTLRLFREKGLAQQEEVNSLFRVVLGTLEKMPNISEPAAQAAHGLVSSLAATMGFPQGAPH